VEAILCETGELSNETVLKKTAVIESVLTLWVKIYSKLGVIGKIIKRIYLPFADNNCQANAVKQINVNR
jgi:hypothetical protein